jgi:homoserine kinase
VRVRHHTVQVPATSANLGPGYDAFGVALDLHLAVRSLPRDAQNDRMTVGGEGASDVVTGDDNLVWRALVAFCDHHDLTVPDVALHTMNRIPLERGLGSSSAAIVAGLVMGRALTGATVGERAIVDLATELEGHPDNVGPALLGGLVVCSRGDDATVVTRRVNPTPRLRPILFVPTARQSTSEARTVLPDHLDVADVVLQASRAGHVLGALTGLWPVDPGLGGDRLHEPARAAVMAPSARLLGSLREAGAHAWLSGAGPSVAAAVPDGAQDRPLLDRCVQLAADEGFVAHLLGFDLSGALACPDDGCALAGQPGCAQCPRERLS